eukprot:1765060-Amphidinium_carterae.1
MPNARVAVHQPKRENSQIQLPMLILMSSTSKPTFRILRHANYNSHCAILGQTSRSGIRNHRVPWRKSLQQLRKFQLDAWSLM